MTFLYITIMSAHLLSDTINAQFYHISILWHFWENVHLGYRTVTGQIELMTCIYTTISVCPLTIRHHKCAILSHFDIVTFLGKCSFRVPYSFWADIINDVSLYNNYVYPLTVRHHKCAILLHFDIVTFLGKCSFRVPYSNCVYTINDLYQ